MSVNRYPKTGAKAEPSGKDEGRKEAFPLSRERPLLWMKQFGAQLKQHLVDATATTFAASPIFCLCETTVLNNVISDQVSLNTKLLAVSLSYSGTNLIYARGRDLSRRLFKVDQTSPERTQAVHDAAYSVAYSLVLNPIVYGLAGANSHGNRNATLLMTALTPFIGYVNGYAIDAFRDFWGFKESERLPASVRSLSPARKKLLAISFVALSVSLMALMYELSPGGVTPSDSLRGLVNNSNMLEQMSETSVK